MADFYTAAFDTKPFEAALQDGAGNPVNLTGATVVFTMGEDGSRILRAPATLVNASQGEVRYSPTTFETSSAGNFPAEFNVTFSDGSIQTFPNDGYIQIHIKERTSGVEVAQLLDLAVASAISLQSKVTAALGQTTSDRFLDLNGDGLVTGSDVDLATQCVTNMTALRDRDPATVTAFDEVPAFINQRIKENIVSGTGDVSSLLGIVHFLFDSTADFLTDGVSGGDPITLPDGTTTILSLFDPQTLFLSVSTDLGSGRAYSIDLIQKPTATVGVGAGRKLFLLDMDDSSIIDGADLSIATKIAGA